MTPALARFVLTVFTVLTFGDAGELAAFVLLVATLLLVDGRGLAGGLAAALRVGAFLSAAVFVLAGGFWVAAVADLAAFFAVTLTAAGFFRAAAGFVGSKTSAISIPNTSASSASSSTLRVAGRFPD